jgi:hypothetical protein
VTGPRLIIGVILMGLIVPLIIFLLLGLTTATTLLAWGVGDFLAIILERPRLQGRTPQGALREDWERRAADEPTTPSRSSS